MTITEDRQRGPAVGPGARPGPRARRPIGLRRRPKDFQTADLAVLGASLASSFAIVWVFFAQLTLLSGPFGFIVCELVMFLVLYWCSNTLLFGRRVATDRLAAAAVAVTAVCMFIPLALMIGFVFAKGWSLLSLHLITSTQKGVLETCVAGLPCPKPGVAHAIVGTLEQITLAAMMGVPAGVLTAVYLNEVGGRFTRAVRIVVTAMSGVPAIVAGAFVLSFWVLSLKQGSSGFAGSLALAVLLLPTVTRGTEEVLRIVPNDLREASIALAAPEWRTVWSVVLPTARSGLITATLLGVAVALGETAPLLLTIFGSTLMNANPFHNPQSALSLLAYTEVHSSQKADIQLAYAAALVLFMMVFTIFILARILGSVWLGNKVRSRLNTRLRRKSARNADAPMDAPVNTP